MTRAVFCACLLSGVVSSQPAEPLSTFEVADVHVSAATRLRSVTTIVHSGRFEMRSATMLDLIRTAYDVEADRVVAGPSWLEMDRFDVIAKTPAKSSPEMLRHMLHALLVDRFGLVAYKETKPVPAYALTADKHTALKAAHSTETGCKLKMSPSTPEVKVPASPAYTCRNMSMAAFAAEMPLMIGAQQYLYGAPVLDKTELRGGWDFDFKYTLRGLGGAAAGDAIPLFDALEKQLGLKLKPTKVTVVAIVVKSVSQKPTANPPGAAGSLEINAPAQFEVSVVKPGNPDAQGMKFQIQPGGRVSFSGVTLKYLIEQAWNITDDMLAGAPKWLDEDRFDIVAKAPAAESVEPSEHTGATVDVDTALVMVRGLLKDRFKLVTHNEDRPVLAYTLVAVKPKMKQADPSSRTKYTQGPAQDAKRVDPRLRMVRVQNMTMAQFAEQLQRIAPSYIHSQVLDATGLDGAYDFTLTFSPASIVRGMGGSETRRAAGAVESSDGAHEASDPTGAISLIEALEKQLGLKLERQKRPISVLVIDHVERMPTEN